MCARGREGGQEEEEGPGLARGTRFEQGSPQMLRAPTSDFARLTANRRGKKREKRRGGHGAL
jgi:hypothetical protein